MKRDKHQSGEDQAFDLMQEVEYGAREPRSAWQRWLLFVIAVGWSVFQIWAQWWGRLDALQLNPIHLAFGIALAFLAYPSKRPRLDLLLLVLGLLVAVGSYVSLTGGAKLAAYLGAGVAILLLWRAVSPQAPRAWIPWLDWLLAAAGVIGSLYILVNFYQIVVIQGGYPEPRDLFIGSLTLFVLTIATVRVVGPALPIIAWVLIGYAAMGPAGILKIEPPDVLYLHSGYQWSQIVQQLYLTTEGIWGTPIRVSATFVYLFVLFGALLDRAGAGEFFVRLAYSALGTFRGGPAKAAVVGSMLTGIISGSSIANVVTTGTFTIPLMKRVGYPPEKAGATEVAASTNGQLMPPVMGAAAFIMAEFLGIPYAQLILYAAVPAILSYIALFYVVHVEALKLGLKGLPREELPRFWPTFFSGVHYMLPVAWLMFELIGLRHTPERSALNAMFLLVVLMLLQRSLPERLVLPAGLAAFAAVVGLSTALGVDVALSVIYVGLIALIAIAGYRLIGQATAELARGLRRFASDVIAGLELGARNMTTIAIATASAGIIVGIVTMTNLGYGLTQVVEALSGGNIIIVLVLSAIASLILGMGLPTTANYIVMVTLVFPVILNLSQAAYEAGQLASPFLPVAIHLFVFYFGILADDTPPVGLAAYAAAAIARANPIRTGIQGFIYDMRTAILPFIFIFNPELLLLNLESPWHAVFVIFTGLVGMLAFVTATQGYWLTWMSWPERIPVLAASFLLLNPNLQTDLIGFAILIAVYLIQRTKAFRGRATA